MNDNVSARVAAAKPAVYKAGGTLPQVAWNLPRKGSMLIIDLWSGFAGAALAFLAMGAQIVLVTAENDRELDLLVAHTIPNAVRIPSVADVKGEDMIAAIKRRSFTAIWIGGGCPCQGNSSLNADRRGIDDQRTVDAKHILRIDTELRQAAQQAGVQLPPIVRWIENVASSPPEVLEYYAKIVGPRPFLFDAAEYGYVARKRLMWACVDGTPIEPEKIPAMKDFEIQWNHSTGKQITPRIAWCGKPFPKSVHLEQGYQMGIAPEQIVQRGGKGAMFTFTREFKHPADRCRHVSKDAAKRFEQDGRRFPPDVYEDKNLLWKGEDWRTYNSSERAQIMGWPMEAITTPEQRVSWTRQERQRNSWLGNGFHAPSIMVFFWIVMQTVQQAESFTHMPYFADESKLRSRVQGTVWQPNFYVNGLLTAREIVKDVRNQMEGIEVPEQVWMRMEDSMIGVDLRILQLYWMDATMRGKNPYELPPEWRDQKDKAANLASLGTQRATSQSSRGLHPLLPPGLGKEAHMKEACNMRSMFEVQPVLDDDVVFAAREMVVFGQWHNRHRELVLVELRKLVEACRHVDHVIKAQQHEDVAQVTQQATPTFMAATTSLLRWPDRGQASKYVTGFPFIGVQESSSVFRQLPQEDTPGEEKELLGDYAASIVNSIMSSSPSPEFAEEIFKQSEEEVQKRFAKPMVSKEHLDRVYGEGQWLPVERFMVRQPSGKLRCIDNGKKYGHNKASKLLETIFTVGLDFVPAAVKLLVLLILSICSEDEIDWFLQSIEVGLIDLLDAYRYVPVEPDQARFSIAAVWHIKEKCWKFLQLLGHAFGLAAAVNNFNRKPALMVAASRRMLGLLCSSYFDDFTIIDFSASDGQGQKHMAELFAMYGAIMSPEKMMPMAKQRIILGQTVNLHHVMDEGEVVLEAKPLAKEEICAELQEMAKMQAIPSARASKVRGKAGWIGSSAYGKCGRIGIGVLKAFQYADKPKKVTEDDAKSLKFLSRMIMEVPPRRVDVFGRTRRFLVVYSDASFEEGKTPRLGWVILEGKCQPIGRSMEVRQELLEALIERKQQIFACEALAIPAALLRNANTLVDCDVLWFVDNEAACSSLVRGASKEEDVASIAGAAHLMMLQNRCRAWFEWIDSDSNPADGLSRDGCLDEWTQDQGWHLRDEEAIRWSEIQQYVS